LLLFDIEKLIFHKECRLLNTTCHTKQMIMTILIKKINKKKIMLR